MLNIKILLYEATVVCSYFFYFLLLLLAILPAIKSLSVYFLQWTICFSYDNNLTNISETVFVLFHTFCRPLV